MSSVALLLSPTAGASPTVDSNEPPCQAGQVAIGHLPPQGSMMKNEVTLTFQLRANSATCTLHGYPGADTAGGEPVLHAEQTLRGYMGGLPVGADHPPTVTLTHTQSAQAVTESTTMGEGGNSCPNYDGLEVTLPDSTETVNIPVGFAACELQVHPVVADSAPSSS